MSSLSDQLLKAGIVTEEQVKKAKEKPKPKEKYKANNKKTNQNKKPHAKKEPSDLAMFYGERKKLENKEKQEQARAKQEAAKKKKALNKKINQLISDHLLNDDAGEVRYNFVVGTSIKYLFVTPEQQQKLADGELAITFLGGKRCLIPKNIAEEITQLSPNKIIIS